MLTQLGLLVFGTTCETRCSLTNLFVDAVAVCLDVAFDPSRSTVVDNAWWKRHQGRLDSYVRTDVDVRARRIGHRFPVVYFSQLK